MRPGAIRHQRLAPLVRARPRREEVAGLGRLRYENRGREAHNSIRSQGLKPPTASDAIQRRAASISAVRSANFIDQFRSERVRTLTGRPQSIGAASRVPMPIQAEEQAGSSRKRESDRSDLPEMPKTQRWIVDRMAAVASQGNLTGRRPFAEPSKAVDERLAAVPIDEGTARCRRTRAAARRGPYLQVSRDRSRKWKSFSPM